MFIYLNKKAQSTAEYVIILGLVVGAVIAMQTYVKRGLQGRVRDAANFVDNAAAETPDRGSVEFTAGGQYEPYYLDSRFETERTSGQNETMTADGQVTRDLTQDDVTIRKANSYQRIRTTEHAD